MTQTPPRMAADACRKQAAELRKQAARAKSSAVKEQLLLMAGDWDKLAEDAADLVRRERATVDGS